MRLPATTIQLGLPHDIVMNNVLPFPELPQPHTFEEVNESDEEDDSDDEEEEMNVNL